MIDSARRRFLAQTMALGCSVAANPIMTPISLAATPGDKRLVVIILRGAMDGLDTVRPIGDKSFTVLRPNTIRDGEVALGDFFTLHPALGKLAPLWKAGELAFAHAVSTPYRDKRSHFDGQNFLEAGLFDGNVNFQQDSSGWLNRTLSRIPNATGQTAFAVGLDNLVILRGDANYSRWEPGQTLPLTAQSKVLFDRIFENNPLFHTAASSAGSLAESIGAMKPMVTGEMMMGGGEEEARLLLGERMIERAKDLATFTAKRLNEDTRIAAFSLGGWDTHIRQNNNLPLALSPLESAILTIKEILGENWKKTTIMCMTEFGRTARENGAGGTDHGTGGAMIMAGGAVRGGKIYGKWPGLGEGQLYVDRDLLPTTDLRVYASSVIESMFGLTKSELGSIVFPGLDTTERMNLIL